LGAVQCSAKKAKELLIDLVGWFGWLVGWLVG